MIDISAETLLTLSAAAKRIPGRNGKGVHLGTIGRWAFDGRRGVVLESLVIGGQRYTSVEALQRFVERLNGASLEDESTPAAPSLLEREREILAAERKIFPAGMVGQGIAAGHGIGF